MIGHMVRALVLLWCGANICQAAADQQVRVGVFDFEPLSSVAGLEQEGGGRETKRSKGVFVELLEEIAGEEQWELQYVPGTYTECLERLENGDLDLVVAVAVTDDPGRVAEYSRESVISSWEQLYTARSLDIRSPLDLSSRALGVVRDDPAYPAMKDFLDRLGVNCNFVEFGSYDEVMVALERGWVDVGAVDRLYGRLHAGQYQVDDTAIILAPVEYRYAIPQGGDRALLDAIDFHFKRLKKLPHSSYYQLVDRIFGSEVDNRFTEFLKWGIAGLGGLLLLAGGLTVILRRQVRRQTAELELKNQALEREVADRLLTEEELRQSELRLRQAQKLEAIGTMAGGIAHDFNNILQPIIGYTELLGDLLAERKGFEGEREHLAAVLRAAERARDLVRQILTFSRQQEQEPRPLRLELMVAEALKLIRAVLPATIEILPPRTGGQHWVSADPTQMHQVLMNLCTNAAHAMKEKGGKLQVSLGLHHGPASGWSADQDPGPGNLVRLSVRDTGTGIEPVVLDRIFDPFFTTKGPGEGTGLGLSVVHGIIKQCGGTISVETKLGKGTTFHCYLPHCLPGADPSVGGDRVRLAGERLRVLLVDDEVMVVEVFRQTLACHGFDVVTCLQSTAALELFRQRSGEFDAVVTDIAMPVMAGDRLAAKLLEIRPDLPVILCSGFAERMTPEQASGLGIRRLVHKPVSAAHLAQIIREEVAGVSLIGTKREVEQTPWA